MEIRAFETFYATYVERVYRFVFYRVGGRVEVAEDLTQEIFLKAYQAFDRYDPALGQSSWIYTIARNHIINHHAKQRPEIAVDEVADARLVSEDGRESFARNVEERRLLEGLSALKGEDALLLQMKYLEGWVFEDLGRIFGKTAGALRVQAGRAMKSLREQLNR